MLEKIKTVLMWYSGFILSLTVISGFFRLHSTAVQPSNYNSKLVALMILAPVLVYVIWEIIDSLNKAK